MNLSIMSHGERFEQASSQPQGNVSVTASTALQKVKRLGMIPPKNQKDCFFDRDLTFLVQLWVSRVGHSGVTSRTIPPKWICIGAA